MNPSPLIVLERTVEIHRRLKQAGIEHAVGGALALAYHVAQARATNDIDLNVTVNSQLPQPLFEILPPEVQWGEADVDRVRNDGQVRLLWPVPGDGTPIPLDLFFPQHELHAAIAGGSELVPMLGTTVPIVSATHLLVFKALFDRRKDWADIEELVRFGKPDLAVSTRWLDMIVGPGDVRLSKLAEIVAEVTGETRP